MASVELRGLTKRYGGAAVVDDVSLHIEHGLLVCLLGPSGCGKTTLLRAIAGVVVPDAGEIEVRGRVGALLSIDADPSASQLSGEALKRELRVRGITYASLAPQLQLSEASVKRMFSRRDFTLRRPSETSRVSAWCTGLRETPRSERVSSEAPAKNMRT